MSFISSRKSTLVVLWLLAGLIVVLHAAMQYTSFGVSLRHQPTRVGGQRSVSQVGMKSISFKPSAAASYRTGYVSDNLSGNQDSYSGGFGRGAVYGGFLAMALGAGLLVTTQLPIVGVAFVSAVSIGLIGRDLQGLMKSRTSISVLQVGFGVCLLVFGASLLSAGNPALLAIASGAASIGFFLRTQSFGGMSIRALPSKSSMPDASRRVVPTRTIVWNSWSRADKGGGDWQPGQPGQNSWQSGNWYARGENKRAYGKTLV